MPSPLSHGPIQKGKFEITKDGQTSFILFQFNPDSLRRQLQPKMVGGNSESKSGPLYFTGPPTETITVRLEISASENASELTWKKVDTYGIRPLLAALEMTLYPLLKEQADAESKLGSGQLEIGVYAMPLLVFQWGDNCRAPVKITSYSVTEQQFNKKLNPVLATVDLGMQVLSSEDVHTSDPAYATYMAYQMLKETMASYCYVAPPVVPKGTAAPLTPLEQANAAWEQFKEDTKKKEQREAAEKGMTAAQKAAAEKQYAAEDASENAERDKAAKKVSDAKAAKEAAADKAYEDEVAAQKATVGMSPAEKAAAEKQRAADDAEKAAAEKQGAADDALAKLQSDRAAKRAEKAALVADMTPAEKAAETAATDKQDKADANAIATAAQRDKADDALTAATDKQDAADDALAKLQSDRTAKRAKEAAAEKGMTPSEKAVSERQNKAEDKLAQAKIAAATKTASDAKTATDAAAKTSSKANAAADAAAKAAPEQAKIDAATKKAKEAKAATDAAASNENSDSKSAAQAADDTEAADDQADDQAGASDTPAPENQEED